MSFDEIKSSEFLIQGISTLGKGKLLRRTNKFEAIFNLKKGIKLLNKAVELDPNNIENRVVRIRHFHGITIDSPISLINIVKKDLDFFEKNYDKLSDLNKGLYYYINGEYFRLKNDLINAKINYEKSISISPKSPETMEAQELLDCLFKNN